jgi:hypothetical protein
MKTIDPHVKSRVIELFQAKKEYREIVQILKAEGIKISFGSCWNIVSKWKGLNRIDGLENQGRESTALRLANPNYVGYSGYFEVGNIYRLPFENSTEPVLMLASGHIPVSNPEINQQPEITQSQTSQPVNTQLQTSTDDLSTFTPVYKENVDLHNEVQPSHPYLSVNTQTSTDNSTMFTPVYSENVDMPDVDLITNPMINYLREIIILL